MEEALQQRFKNMTSRQVFDLKAENADLQDAMKQVGWFECGKEAWVDCWRQSVGVHRMS